MAMRTKVRITSVKDEGTTFEQQYLWWRAVLKHDPNQRLGREFSNWGLKNFGKILLIAQGKMEQPS